MLKTYGDIMSEINFDIYETTNSNGTIIKVVGVGGAGGNATSHMIKSGLNGVDFICANTDSQALKSSGAGLTIQLGKDGLGAGANPEKGSESAREAESQIENALRGANMVFITAGMGGGTGTGAAPFIAEIAQRVGALTVGVVTKPFEFEGNKRMRVAEQGVEALSKHVHSLIVVLNDNLSKIMDEDATQEECFKEADNVLYNACSGIADIINVEGNINVDFEDVRTIMNESGRAMMGTGRASGPNRATEAAHKAIDCPLLEGVQLKGAKGLLVNITASKGVKLKETREIMEIIKSHGAAEATIIFGTAYDETMGDEIKVTVIATGLGDTNERHLRVVDNNHPYRMQEPVVTADRNNAERYDMFAIPAYLRKNQSEESRLEVNGGRPSAHNNYGYDNHEPSNSSGPYISNDDIPPQLRQPSDITEGSPYEGFENLNKVDKLSKPGILRRSMAAFKNITGGGSN